MRGLGSVLAAALVLTACGGGEKPDAPLPTTTGRLTLTSPAFAPGGRIPQRFTCDGDGVPPPLSWSGVPPRARQLALVVEDPDAGRFVHWTVLKIPPTQTRFGEGSLPARRRRDRQQLRQARLRRAMPTTRRHAAPLRLRALRHGCTARPRRALLAGRGAPATGRARSRTRPAHRTLRARRVVTALPGDALEVKELLAGFFLIECDSIERAIEHAARVPEAVYGLVEVRPVLDLNGPEL